MGHTVCVRLALHDCILKLSLVVALDHGAIARKRWRRLVSTQRLGLWVVVCTPRQLYQHDPSSVSTRAQQCNLPWCSGLPASQSTESTRSVSWGWQC